MKTIAVASMNPVKIEAARGAFARVFPDVEFDVVGVAAPSGVSDQPASEAETFQGALNRVASLRETHPNADYRIAFEGGIEDDGTDMAAFAWAVIEDAEGRLGKGKTGTFILPKAHADHVRGGMELGEADDLVFGMTNSKQKNGTVGILTRDHITRTTYYIEAATLALIPFLHPDLY